MAGRPKKPTEVKKLQGTYERSREIENQMQTEAVTKVPPLEEYYPEYTQNLWKSLCTEMIKIKMLQHGDLQALKAYVAACHMQDYAYQMLQSEGATMETVNGKRVNPWVSIWKESINIIKTLGNEFGFTPASRSKIAMPEKTKDDNPLENINSLLAEAIKEQRHLKKVS